MHLGGLRVAGALSQGVLSLAVPAPLVDLDAAHSEAASNLFLLCVIYSPAGVALELGLQLRVHLGSQPPALLEHGLPLQLASAQSLVLGTADVLGVRQGKVLFRIP